MLSHKIVKFGVAGIFNTSVDWFLYFLLAKILGQHEINAKVVGAIGGVTSAFILNAWWVFRSSFLISYRSFSGKWLKLKFVLYKYSKMVTAYSVGMLVNVGVFTICIYIALPELAALVIATAFSFNINFILAKKMVFR